MANLEITTMLGCPLACTFCPQDALRKNYGKSSDKMMTFDTFKTVINKLPKHVAIGFSGMSEPFANPDCMDFLEYSSSMPNSVSLYSTLDGLTKENTDRLEALIKKDNLEKVVVHLPDDTGNMRGFFYKEQYLYALEKILPLQNVSCMTMSEKALIDENLFKEIQKSHLKEEILKKLPKNIFKGWRRAGSLNTDFVKDQAIENEVSWKCGISCASTPFYDHNVLLPDGRVVLCCMDYGMKHVIGNLLKDDYYDLFKSEEMNKIKIANMNVDLEEKKYSICTNCENVCKFEVSKGSSTWVNTNQNVSLKVLAKNIKKRIKRKIFNLSPFHSANEV